MASYDEWIFALTLAELNEVSSPTHYLWNGQQLLAMFVFPPTEKRLTPQEMRTMTQVLLKRSKEDLPQVEQILLAS